MSRSNLVRSAELLATRHRPLSALVLDAVWIAVVVALVAAFVLTTW